MKHYITSELDYDYRIMEKFAKLLRGKKINHTYQRKSKTLIIHDGYYTVFKVISEGYWLAYRIDDERYANTLKFTFPVNGIDSLILKCARFRLIPYEKIERLV